MKDYLFKEQAEVLEDRWGLAKNAPPIVVAKAREYRAAARVLRAIAVWYTSSGASIAELEKKYFRVMEGLKNARRIYEANRRKK